MTCKDNCLYYEVCQDFKRNICKVCNLRHTEFKINRDGLCDYFKDKSKYIELSCKVGDKIYRPVVDYVRVETVMLIIQRIFKDELVVTLHTEYSTYDLKEIGDCIFLTKSEAEAKLKELQDVR